MKKQYGLGIAGYGSMALHHHNNLAKADGLSVVAAYDIDPKRVSLAEEKGLAGFATLEALLSDKQVDIVLVATPNNFHKDFAIEAMKRGKHVICEKPVAMSSDELVEMMQVAKKYGVLFTIHQNRRMDKDYLIVKNILKEGILGKVFTVQSRVQGSRGVPKGWRQYKVAGGGMMLDWGVHLIDQVAMMLPGNIQTVFAQMHSINCPEVDDAFKLILGLESGVSVQIDVDTCVFLNLPRWYVAGDKGTLVIDDWSCTGKIVRAKETQVAWEEEIVYTKAGPTKTMAPRAKSTIEEISLVEPDNDYTLSYQNLIAAIEGREEILVHPHEALRVMKIMEAAFASHEKGCSISVDL